MTTTATPSPTLPAITPTIVPDDEAPTIISVAAYRISFLGYVINANGSTTWRYRLEELNDAPDLVSWTLGLSGCRVSSATPSPNELVNPDPDSGINGVRWTVTPSFTSGEFSVTLENVTRVRFVNVAARGSSVLTARIAGPGCGDSGDDDDGGNDDDDDGGNDDDDDDGGNDDDDDGGNDDDDDGGNGNSPSTTATAGTPTTTATAGTPTTTATAGTPTTTPTGATPTPTTGPGQSIIIIPRLTIVDIDIRFRLRWLRGNSLRIYGYPLTRAVVLRSGIVVQYFERARFEYHPAFAGTEYEVLLGRLAVELGYQRPPVAPPSNDDDRTWYFPVTGHLIDSSFRTTWRDEGALLVYGYPIGPAFVDDNGRLVQYFERSRMEVHTDTVSRRTTILFGLLGEELLIRRGGNPGDDDDDDDD